jgi:ABC-type nickel/cobalt efflux system permease component RcnA
MKINMVNWLSLIVFLIFICIIIWIIYNQVSEYYASKDGKLHYLKTKLHLLHPDAHKLKLLKGKKSYSINKEKIFLCLYDEQGEYYHDNHLMYVLIHELSHCINKHDVGHTETWQKIFDEQLEEAAKLGIWDPNIPMDEQYCKNGSGK